MFSSLASFLFGTNTTSETTPSIEEQQQLEEEQQQRQQQQQPELSRREVIDAGDVIQVTSTTPSVTGTSNSIVINSRRGGKRGKQRRNAAKPKQQQQVGGAQKKPSTPPTITKLLTAGADDSLDEDEWYIVEKEDDEEQSLPRSDSEEEVSIVEVQQQQQPRQVGTSPTTGTRRLRQSHHHINTHSLYSGPRPHQQRNYLQRAARANGARAPLSISTLSPQRSVPSTGAGNNTSSIEAALADSSNGVTQSLYAAPSASPNGSDYDHGASNMSMEESWYVTPPPCFTSIGPINMETSPFENLLIEHPSMSVYHSIRSAQVATESFVSLDLGVNEMRERQQRKPIITSNRAQHQHDQEPQEQQLQTPQQAVQQRNGNTSRIDRQAAAQLKQQALARNSQKSCNKKDHQNLCRGAIKRANKVREVQSKSQRPRRSDMQHCKLNSGANNNRKCCY